ncbi:MAG: aminotransferase class I/II-fold pyridoxal phosphate-dependent enzyme [Candidatus Delongbacteria bacterium]|nr:aminotransferase class I/II-fold pyridoxal phosphate-dependent enzyme [Candidatus Delongbacteria bacterium]
MHPIAEKLNHVIAQNHPEVWEMLSPFGKQLYFPKGIVSQSAEAALHAKRYNATIGMALENGRVMCFDYAMDWMSGLDRNEIFPYAPTAGLPGLIDLWRKKQIRYNPAMADLAIGKPIVTAAITHGLFIISDLLVAPGDTIILPDLYWGNYSLIFKERRGAEIKSFSLFNHQSFNLKAFQNTLQESQASKLVIILNFPNNPTGYTPTDQEMHSIRDIILEKAQTTRIVVICDDAYFGLFYRDGLFTQSPFCLLANAHPNILAVKLDAGTKEEYIWGLRVGFITLGIQGGTPDLYLALQEKIKGAIRSSVSNNPMISQSILKKILEHPDYIKLKEEKFQILKKRALKTQQVASNPKYEALWDVLPFNSGYFMCLKLKTVNAEKLRLHLLHQFGIGTISINDQVMRIAFSNIEESQLEELFNLIAQAIGETVE